MNRDTMAGYTREQVRRMCFDELCIIAREAGVTLSELVAWATEGVELKELLSPRGWTPTKTRRPR